ncbi:MAG: sodium:solute symporter [Limisphaerales bacterium]
MIPIYIIAGYLLLLLGLGLASNHFFRGTSKDYFVASHSIGPFMLLMSIFGTTMTAFALVGSTGKAYTTGIGVYGLMASWSGLIHAACFFLIGIRLWAFGKRYGYVTQVQFFRERFESPWLGHILFPVLVLLVIPYLLIGIIGAGSVMRGLTVGTFVEAFPDTKGAIPSWLTGAVICLVVLAYVFWGGVRGAVWANTFQTLVFMATGVVAFWMIAKALGGPAAASQKALELAPELLAREGKIGHLQFLSYCFVPLSVGMFPHLFQHWLTAKSAKSFRLTCVAHPICIMIVWIPCILIGIWAAGAAIKAPPNAVLGKMVGELVHNPYLTGLLIAGVLAAIMSSLDSQFMCLGTMFTRDVVGHIFGEDRFTDRQTIWLARGFIVFIVAVTYVLSLFPPPHVFDLGVWCFSGFAGLFPLALAALYWRRVTKAGAIASVLVMAALWGVLFARDMAAKSGNDGADELLVFGMMPVAIIVAAAALTLVVVSLVTQPPSAKTVEKFFPKA